jgi:phosphatidylglycerophosphate synthase
LTEPLDVILLVNHPGMLHERLAGMTLLERQLFTLRNAGVRRVLLSAHTPGTAALASLRRPAGLEIILQDELKTPWTPPYASVSADHLLRSDAVASLLKRPHAQPTAYHDEAGRSVVQFTPFSDENAPTCERALMPAGSCLALENPLDGEPTMAWLFRDAGKSHDSFMARHFDRRLSTALSRRLLDTRITPNAMTVFSTLVGVFGAALMAYGGYAATLAGTLVVWAHTVFDGCDGELARLRFQQSALGGFLDFWGDNVVHACLFFGLGVGLMRSMGGIHFLLIGAAAAVGALLTAWDVYRHRAAHAEPGRPLFDGLGEQLASESSAASPALRRLAALEDALARRDFVYLLILLAWIDYPEAFLWAAGIGTPLFLWALIYLRHAGEGRTLSAPLRRTS